MFSRACEYGIRASIFIVSKTKTGGKVGVKEICKNIDAPVAFTAKVLQILTKNDLISSIKGPSGGFFISREQLKVPLVDIVKTIDGDQLFEGCGLGLPQCSDTKPCPIHYDFKHVRDELTKMLAQTTLIDLTENLEKGTYFLSRRA